MTDIKLGGGHHLCDKCGQIVFGSKLHTCKYEKLNYWKKRCELAEKYIRTLNKDYALEDALKAFCEWLNFIKKDQS